MLQTTREKSSAAPGAASQSLAYWAVRSWPYGNHPMPYSNQWLPPPFWPLKLPYGGTLMPYGGEVFCQKCQAQATINWRPTFLLFDYVLLDSQAYFALYKPHGGERKGRGRKNATFSKRRREIGKRRRNRIGTPYFWEKPFHTTISSFPNQKSIRSKPQKGARRIPVPKYLKV